ncbi:DUF6058 family natural product biosynthesis protein [Microbulbifer epialgicus]|uniref:DUF6058 family natural product biosynthesis protein n=1 Tax=Microbulbifer epialgicus TaxID=393907 RepID=A0ABV4P4L6_9GAMM
MKLIEYLNDHFFTKEELLEFSQTSNEELTKYQENGLMPRCSYKLNTIIKSNSFFGYHETEVETEYYAKGYVSWVSIVRQANAKNEAFQIFSGRYKSAIKNLKDLGHFSSDSKISTEIDDHIKKEWEHFLSGTYGLCTKSGLPEDIAAKEIAILEINELLENNELSSEQVAKLTTAVNLLDSSSSQFAPHERLQSSRHRLINEVRRKYRLES